MKTKDNRFIKYYLFLHILLAFYCISGVFSKKASSFEFLSLGFIGCYCAVVLILFVYALFWQQIIKHIPLTTAFCNKAVEIIWGIIFGVLIFHEQIKWNMVVGACIVIIGVVLVVTADE